MQRETGTVKSSPSLALAGLVALIVVAMAGMAACGSEPAEPESAPEPEAAEEPAEEPAMDMTPGVFFVAPEEGATVSSPVHFEFGAENFIVEPVGEGEIHEGAGHHHIGLDTDCLPVGEIVPEAAPWIHFGDASATIDMQMEAGEHRVSLQIGDGEHRTLEGLCSTVTFTVE